MIGASENFMLLNLNLGAVGDTRLLRCNILIFVRLFTEETVPATEISVPSCDALSHYDSDDVTDNRGDRHGKPSAEHDAQEARRRGAPPTPAARAPQTARAKSANATVS